MSAHGNNHNPTLYQVMEFKKMKHHRTRVQFPRHRWSSCILTHNTNKRGGLKHFTRSLKGDVKRNRLQSRLKMIKMLIIHNYKYCSWKKRLLKDICNIINDVFSEMYESNLKIYDAQYKTNNNQESYYCCE